MGDEGTEIRLRQHDNDIKEVKSGMKEVKIEIKDINKSIIEIEKTDIRIEVDVRSILETYKVIRNATIGFIVLNILTMLWTLGKMNP